MYYLVFPDGSKLFQTPFPEDFVYHCLFLALDKGLDLRLVKVLDCRGLFLLLIELFYFLRTFLCFAFSYCLKSSVFSAFLGLFLCCGFIFSALLSVCMQLSPFPCYLKIFRLRLVLQSDRVALLAVGAESSGRFDPVWYYGVTNSQLPLDNPPVICYNILVKIIVGVQYNG